MKVFEVLGKVVLIVLISFSASVFGGIFSLCANNQNFMFSSEACPGGIFFKSPVTINETCYCFPSDMAIYSSCPSELEPRLPVRIPHSVTTCSRAPDVTNQEVQLLIPLNTRSPSLKYTYCPFIPSSCDLKPHNQAFKQPFLLSDDTTEAEAATDSTTIVTESLTDSTYSPNDLTTEVSNDEASFKSIDEAEHKVPSSIVANVISRMSGDDKTDDEIFTGDKRPSVKRKLEASNEVLSFAEMFAEQESSTFGRKMKIHKRTSDDDSDDAPQSQDEVSEIGNSEKNFLLRTLADKLTAEMVEGLSYNSESKGASLLRVTSEMFKLLAPSDIIQDETIDDIFHTFVATHLLGNRDVDASSNYITDDMFHQIMNGLLLCQEVDEGFSEYDFESDSSCPPTIQKFVNSKTRKAISVEELHGKLPSSFSYVPEKENFVVGLMWKMVEAIHAACFGTWMNFDGSIPIFYWSFLEHFFLQDDVIGLFENESTGTSRYEGIIEAVKPLENVTFNVDTLVAAIHSKSQFPNFFPKPTLKNHDIASEGSDSVHKDMKDIAAPESEVSTSSEASSRRKRSVVDLELNAFEIWDGQAYCLQQLDVNQPPSIENTFPLLPQLCHLHH